MKRVGLILAITSLILSQAAFVMPVAATDSVVPAETPLTPSQDENNSLDVDDDPEANSSDQPSLGVSNLNYQSASSDVFDGQDDSQEQAQSENQQSASDDQDGQTETDSSADDQAGDSIDGEQDDQLPDASQLLIVKIQVGLKDDTAAEFIELYNPGDDDVLLNNWRLQYLSSSYDPQDGDVPELLLALDDIQLASQSSLVIANAGYIDDLADFTYGHGTNQLAQNGTIRLLHDSEVVDMVGWGDAGQYLGSAPAAAEKYGSIERCIDNDLAQVVDSRDNRSDFATYLWPQQAPAIGLIAVCLGGEDQTDDETGDSDQDEPELPPVNLCEGLRLSEIATNVERQYIEVYNHSQEAVDLKGCRIESQRDDGQAVFGEIEVVPGDYEVIYLDEDQTLSLYKTTYDTVYLLSSDGANELDAQKYQDLDDETSWSLIDGQWQQTYALTPGEANRLELYPPCPVGKQRNPLTGRCVNVETTIGDQLVPCAVHQYRNPETNRCNNKVSAASADLKPCRADQYRNPATNRCKLKVSTADALVPCDPDQYRNPETNRCRKIGSAAQQLKPCDEGYERNPETNRCRKQRASLGEVAGYAVEPIQDSAQSTLGWWAFGGVALLAAGYGVWEWRHEIRRLIRR